MQPEYADEGAETRCGDSLKVHGGDLQSNRGVRIGVFKGSGIFQLLGSGSTPVRRVIPGGSPEHMEGETSLGAVREVFEVGASGPNHCREVLLRGVPGGATLWVGNLGIDGRNITSL